MPSQLYFPHLKTFGLSYSNSPSLDAIPFMTRHTTIEILELHFDLFKSSTNVPITDPCSSPQFLPKFLSVQARGPILASLCQSRPNLQSVFMDRATLDTLSGLDYRSTSVTHLTVDHAGNVEDSMRFLQTAARLFSMVQQTAGINTSEHVSIH